MECRAVADLSLGGDTSQVCSLDFAQCSLFLPLSEESMSKELVTQAWKSSSCYGVFTWVVEFRELGRGQVSPAIQDRVKVGGYSVRLWLDQRLVWVRTGGRYWRLVLGLGAED